MIKMRLEMYEKYSSDVGSEAVNYLSEDRRLNPSSLNSVPFV